MQKDELNILVKIVWEDAGINKSTIGTFEVEGNLLKVFTIKGDIIWLGKKAIVSITPRQS